MDKFADEALAARIKFVMEAQGITITEAAERISVPYRTLQNQLSGKNRMSASTFAKMLDLLDIPVSFLTHDRITLNRDALARAIKDLFGDSLPTFDDEMQMHAPTSERTLEQLKKDLALFSHLFANRYEVNTSIALRLSVKSRSGSQ